MKRIRIAICDDDSIGRGLLQESLEYLLQENNLQAEISSYCSGQELLREQNRYDILFLDIRMPKINGIRTAEKYREWYEDTIIIFLTSYEDYVFEGYKVNAFRYLKKPMEQEKLREALLSAVSKLEKEYEIDSGMRKDCILSDPKILFMWRQVEETSLYGPWKRIIT